MASVRRTIVSSMGTRLNSHDFFSWLSWIVVGVTEKIFPINRHWNSWGQNVDLLNGDFPRVLSTRTIVSSMFISCSSVLNPAIRMFKLIYMFFCNSTFAILSLLFFRVVIIEPDLFRRSKIQPETYLSNVMLPLLKSAKVDLVACSERVVGKLYTTDVPC